MLIRRVESRAMLHTFAPFRLGAGPISDDQLGVISEASPGWHVERDANGDLILSPTSSRGGAKSGEAFFQLALYKRAVGGHVYDADTGFTMPDGSVLAPDACWIDDERYATIDKMASTGKPATYWRVVGNVMIEVRSHSDSWSATVAKIDAYFDWGATYAVAIDPTTREIYERGAPPPGLRFDFDAVIDAE